MLTYRAAVRLGAPGRADLAARPRWPRSTRPRRQRDRGARRADLRRLRLLARLPGGTLLPRRARDDDLRGNERDPAHGRGQEPAGGEMTVDDHRDDEALAPRDLVPAPSPAPEVPRLRRLRRFRGSGGSRAGRGAGALAASSSSGSFSGGCRSPAPAPDPPAPRAAVPRQDRRGLAAPSSWRPRSRSSARRVPFGCGWIRPISRGFGSCPDRGTRRIESWASNSSTRRRRGSSSPLPATCRPDSEVRVVVDPYSRQAFLAVGRTIQGIVSF